MLPNEENAALQWPELCCEQAKFGEGGGRAGCYREPKPLGAKGNNESLIQATVAERPKAGATNNATEWSSQGLNLNGSLHALPLTRLISGGRNQHV